MNLSQVVNDAFEKRQATYIRAIVEGVKTHEEYRFLVGCIRGMFEFHEDIKKYLADPDEEEGR